MSLCDDCIHRDVCGNEDAREDAVKVCVDFIDNHILTVHDIEKIKEEIERSKKSENVPYEAEYWGYVNALDKTLSIIECQMCVKEALSTPEEEKGEWILKCEFPRRWECSCCHTSSYEYLDHCPKCNADMRGE